MDEVAGHDFDSTAPATAARVSCGGSPELAIGRSSTAIRITALLFACASGAVLVRGESPPAVDAGALWKPPAGFRAALAKSCGAGPAGTFRDCFLRQMQSSGAPPAAVAFARRTGAQGYLRAFRETGRVDAAFAEYPFRANENQICFLVNGDPPTIDVDDAAWIDRARLLANPNWQAIRRVHPDVAVFPGNRLDPSSVSALPRPGGGQRFLVAYSLHAGCHACAVVGAARVAFDFDSNGRLLSTRLVSVKPEHSAP